MNFEHVLPGSLSPNLRHDRTSENVFQTYGIFAIAYIAAKKMGLGHNIAAPACMIATSNFFELAVAVAISLFGLHSGAALATVVGVLVEVPVMGMLQNLL